MLQIMNDALLLYLAQYDALNCNILRTAKPLIHAWVEQIKQDYLYCPVIIYYIKFQEIIEKIPKLNNTVENYIYTQKMDYYLNWQMNSLSDSQIGSKDGAEQFLSNIETLTDECLENKWQEYNQLWRPLSEPDLSEYQL